MKKAIGCSAQVFVLLALVTLTALPIACIAAATAPMHSPNLAESFVCPPDSKLEAEWYQATWNHPGERTLSVVCIDAQGKTLSTLPQDSRFWLGGLKVFFPYAFIPILMVGALILVVLNALGIVIAKAWKRLAKQNTNS
jgi:hypothetical protein